MADNKLNQTGLDAIVSERLEWVSRFAASVAHDLGNVVLFAASPRSEEDSEPTEALQKCIQSQADLVVHVRDILSRMTSWRNPHSATPQQLTPRAWWSRYGSMSRQFVSGDVRVSLLNGPSDLAVDTKQLIQLIPAMLIAIDVQTEGLQRVAIEITERLSPRAVIVRFIVSPAASLRSMFLPAMAIRASESCEYGSVPGAEYVSLILPQGNASDSIA